MTSSGKFVEVAKGSFRKALFVDYDHDYDYAHADSEKAEMRTHPSKEHKSP